MIYEFAGFELDTSQVELRRDGKLVALQPQVFALLLLLVENHDRMVSRDEIIDKVWNGRIVSETAISTRIKAVRRAVGDDGQAQRLIRTIHSLGFRCVGDVRIRAEHVPTAIITATSGGPLSRGTAAAPPSGRPSIAVLPFHRIDHSTGLPSIEDAIPHEIIVALSRLRWLFVIARGSAFRFREASPDVLAVGSALGVRYCLTGVIEVRERDLVVTTELAGTGDGGIVWSDRFQFGRDEIHAVRSRITASVVAALETHIPENEARIARLAMPDSIDTWAIYHLGIQHMYRFNRADNQKAAAFFSQSLHQDPDFARAHAGLSFTSFQHAYLHYSDDTRPAIAAARAEARRSVEIDPHDAFGNFTLGRSYWLEGAIDESLEWLDRSTKLSPSFAQSFYARAWADTMLGRGAAGRSQVDAAMELSPLDPFMYAMKGTKALSYLVEDNPAAAIPWIEEAARTPGAHPVVGLVAAATAAINGDLVAGSMWLRRAVQRNPHVSRDYFFRSIPFADPRLRARISRALADCGLD
jgi:TolB-like protein